jgi:ribosomal protein L37AE/L43A
MEEDNPDDEVVTTGTSPPRHDMNLGEGVATIQANPTCPSCGSSLGRVTLHAGETLITSCEGCGEKIKLTNRDSRGGLSETLEADQ